MSDSQLHNDLRGKTVLVTGAASGIGEGIARGLASLGVRVVAADIQFERVTQIAREIGNGAIALHVDTSSERSIEEAFSKVDALYGLVNVAGILTRVPLLQMRAIDIDTVIGINLRGFILCVREAAKKIIQGGAGSGAIVNVCSITAHHGSKSLIHYGASKGGVLAATKGMALELAEHGIRVNSISPGVVKTALNAARLSDPAQVALSAGGTAIKRIGMPEDLVGITELLLSDRSAWVTGVDIVIDGGQLAG